MPDRKRQREAHEGKLIDSLSAQLAKAREAADSVMNDVQFELNIAIEFCDYVRAERIERIKTALQRMAHAGLLSAQLANPATGMEGE